MAAARRLRVLHMIGAAKAGGAEMFAYRLLVALHARKDLEILAVVRKGWLEGQLRTAGVPVAVVPFGGMFDWKTKGMVRKIAADFRPAVVQSWMNRATRFVPRGNWATVARLGGFYDLKYYRGKVRDLVCNTPMLVEYCIREGWEKARVAMISNFIPAPAPGWEKQRRKMRKTLGVRDPECLMMMAGRLHRVKGVDTALRALAGLPDGFVLLLVGEGPLRAELEALATQLGVAPRVRWAGWQDNVAPFAAAADIWLAPSRHEPLGNTVLDAWVHKVPVVASRTGGLEMLVQDGKTGLSVAVGDVDGLRAAIVKLEGSKALREKLVKGGLAAFAKDYSADGIVGKYVAYYKALAMREQTHGRGTDV